MPGDGGPRGGGGEGTASRVAAGREAKGPQARRVVAPAAGGYPFAPDRKLPVGQDQIGTLQDFKVLQGFKVKALRSRLSSAVIAVSLSPRHCLRAFPYKRGPCDMDQIEPLFPIPLLRSPQLLSP